MRVLCAAVEASRARVAADHRVRALVIDDDGAIVGRRSPRRSARGAFVRARRGVVLTTGGFIHNDRMLEAHAPLARRCRVRVGAEGDDGSGIQLGIAAGAATLHMDAVSISLPVDAALGPQARRARRRAGPALRERGRLLRPARRARAAAPRRPRVARRGRRGVREAQLRAQPVAAVGDTPDELERELGLPGGQPRGDARALQPPRRARASTRCSTRTRAT